MHNSLPVFFPVFLNHTFFFSLCTVEVESKKKMQMQRMFSGRLFDIVLQHFTTYSTGQNTLNTLELAKKGNFLFFFFGGEEN